MIPALFAAAVFFVIGMSLVTFRLGRREGGAEWAAGWVCLYVSGAFAVAAQQWPSFGPLYPLFGTAFAGLLFLGATRFADLAIPRWVIPLIIATGIARALSQPFVSYAAVQGQAFLVLLAGTVGAIWAIRQRRGRADVTIWEIVLCWSLLLIPIAHGGFAASQLLIGDATMALVVWLVVGIWVAGLQSGSLLARAAGRAEEARDTLATLVDAVPAGLALGDRDGRIRATNPAFVELLRAPNRNSLVGRPFDEASSALAEALLDPGDLDLARSEHQELRLRDGRIVILDQRAVQGRTGREAGKLWLLRDVTEERRLAEALDRSRRLETLGRLAGGVAHDFNNKLTVILGGAALLRPIVEKAEPRRRERLDDLETAAQYCANLTRDLLDFAKKTPREPRQIAPAEYLNKLADRFQRDMPRGVTLEASIEPDTPSLEADPLQLERVLTNLVYNARDALGSTGKIEIHARPHGEDTVAITVRDDGPGMDAATSERAFDPFFTTKGPGGGTGLGLAIVFSLVESNGGEVSVETSPGGGAAFLTVWPRFRQMSVA